MDSDGSQASESLALSAQSTASTPATRSPEDLDHAPTATSSALAIAEVMDTILDHVRSQPSGYKVTLASLARTCKSFQEIALDVLYQDLDSLSDLLRCMTSDICMVNDDRTSMVFHRSMWPWDINTLRRYAVRVKTLTIRAREPQLDSESILAVCMIPMAPGLTLCPNLHSLVWETTAEHYLPLLPCLISSGLSYFTLPLKYASCLWSYNIPSLCPSLRKFSITGRSKKPVDLGFLRRWPHLTTLKFPDTVLSERTEIDCIFLPNLRELSLMVTGGRSFGSRIANLSKLEIRSKNSIDSINSFLSRWIARGLVELTVLTCGDSTEQHLVSFFDIISEPGSHRRLRCLTVANRIRTSFGQQRSAHLDVNIFRPLFQCHDLVSISIDVASFDMNDHHLEELALAFPKLEYLQILTFPPNGKPLNTVHGLIPLLRHCPKLSDLTISFDASSIPDSMDCPGVRHLSLNRLACIGSPINDAAQVAVFLSDAMPCVRLVTDDSVGKDQWQEVARLLKYFVVAREHERKRCKKAAA